MSRAVTRVPGRRPGAPHDAGAKEIVALSIPDTDARVSSEHLPPEQALASLPSPCTTNQPTIAPLTRYLGPILTFANPAWTVHAIPLMRKLQKRLIAHALSLAQEARWECLDAVSVVEGAVRLRVRLEQLRVTAAEMELARGEGKGNEREHKGQKA